jgi:hypothetical protein
MLEKDAGSGPHDGKRVYGWQLFYVVAMSIVMRRMMIGRGAAVEKKACSSKRYSLSCRVDSASFSHEVVFL